MFELIIVMLSITALSIATDCEPSITTASGWAAPIKICSGQLIFEENFDTLNKNKWKPEVTFRLVAGNEEFQWYTADDENSFAKDGKLHIRPTLTADKIGYNTIEYGRVHLDDCTDPNEANCDCTASGRNAIINPVRSARLRTPETFSFKYGHVEVFAKAPQGDWLWPAIWLLPTENKYGKSPRSGEIDLMELRGNENYGNETEIAVEHVASTIHFSPRRDQIRSMTYTRNNASGFDKDFHKFEFIWNTEGIIFFLDGTRTGSVAVGDGFWKRGRFEGENIWANATKMAPFDQEFHFIINLAVGGTSGYFPDGLSNKNGPKPWRNRSPTAMKDFWTQRNQWLHSWDSEKSSLIVDSVKVWAL